MTWGNRFRLLGGLIIVVFVVGAATLVLNQRETQVASTTASIKAQTYSVGSDYAGTVVKQSVTEGQKVKQGDPILAIQSATLLRDLGTQKHSPTSTAYTVAADGTLTLVATQSGIVSKVDATVGGFVSAGQPLATIDRSGSLYGLAEFKVNPTDFARIDKGAKVELVLPNHTRVSGKVHAVSVHTVRGQADALIEVSSPSLVAGGHDGLDTPGTPITAILHLRDDGPFAGVKDALYSLLEQVGI